MTANSAYFYVSALLAGSLLAMSYASVEPLGSVEPVDPVMREWSENAVQPAVKALLAAAESTEPQYAASKPNQPALQPAGKTTPFEQLTQKFENGEVFHANFSHQYVDSYTGDRSTQSGEIWIGDEEYKIESASQRVAVDGKISRVYDSNRGRLIISTYVPEEDDFAPSRILKGVDSTYAIVEQEQKADKYFIKLRSDDPFAMFQEVEITLNENNIPVKIFVRDPGDNEITTTFSGGSFIDRNATMFDLNYPDSAEVVDMRN